MDEVRSSKLGVRLTAADRIGAATTPDSSRHYRLVNVAVAGAVLAVGIGLTLYIWHDVGTPILTATAPAATQPAADPDVREIEQLLNDLSFTPGTIDGVVDPETTEAIRAFQQAAGLPDDGQPSPGLLEELKAVAGQSS